MEKEWKEVEMPYIQHLERDKDMNIAKITFRIAQNFVLNVRNENGSWLPYITRQNRTYVWSLALYVKLVSIDSPLDC